MELSSNEEGEIPLPINSTYVGGHMIHHDHHNHHHHHNNIMPSSIVPQIPNTNGPIDPIQSPNLKKMVRYRECLKNHAASMGGNATDGCGEFMPSGEEGSIEALTCSACSCHRNFHRKELEGESPHHHHHFFNRSSRKLLLGHPKMLGPEYPTRGGIGGPGVPHQMIMSYNLASESDEQEDGGGVVIARPTHQIVKKRFRTKFSVEQKEKMLNFAEKVGWKIQKQEEGVVQQFCQEIGVKRRVLKVWMHNNKNTLAKKMINHPSFPPPPTVTATATGTT